METLGPDDQPYGRVRFVERRLGRGRRFVQALDAATPSQLAGSAPIIWDLLDTHPSVDALTPELQKRFNDSPEIIASGVRSALAMLIESSLIVPVGGDQ